MKDKVNFRIIEDSKITKKVKICPDCGTANKEDAKFCSMCASNMEDLEAKNIEDVKRSKTNKETKEKSIRKIRIYIIPTFRRKKYIESEKGKKFGSDNIKIDYITECLIAEVDLGVKIGELKEWAIDFFPELDEVDNIHLIEKSDLLVEDEATLKEYEIEDRTTLVCKWHYPIIREGGPIKLDEFDISASDRKMFIENIRKSIEEDPSKKSVGEKLIEDYKKEEE